jgi:protein-S-isoprenylcysteine O-methyltransferase Ste14
MAGHAHSLSQALAASIGGGTALVVHLIKSGIKLGVNASPEPFSNIVVSLIEDLVVAGIVVLALLHPLPAAIIAAVLLVLGLILVIALARRIRRAWRNRRERRRQRQSGTVPAPSR